MSANIGPHALLEEVLDKLSPEKQDVLRSFINQYIALQYAGQEVDTKNMKQLKHVLKRL